MIWKIFIILFLFIVSASIDIPGIIKNKQWRELTVYSGFLLFGFAFTIIHNVLKYDFSVFTHWLINLTSSE